MEVLWKKIPAPLGAIKAAGFDGVECHLLGKLLSPQRVMELREEAAKLDLGIRFHQGWSWETGQRIVHNYILRPLGALVPSGTSLAEQVVSVGTDPVVVYGSRVGEPTKPHYLYQTSSEFCHGKAYAKHFQDFVAAVIDSKLPVVFDTQHVLEWSLDEHYVTGLPTARENVAELVYHLWQKFSPFTKEIHLCDYDPRLGPSHGRNVFLGRGVFPLKEFCTGVRLSGWEGIVTPEVSPQYLRERGSLEMLRAEVGRLLG